ncbi:MAG: hypothetical protein ACP6IS_12805 [Candidatus Asgardarchaeia archaeon]
MANVRKKATEIAKESKVTTSETVKNNATLVNDAQSTASGDKAEQVLTNATLLDKLSAFKFTGNISEEGKHYIEILKTIASTSDGRIKYIDLSDENIAAHAFFDTSYAACIFVFKEGSTTTFGEAVDMLLDLAKHKYMQFVKSSDSNADINKIPVLQEIFVVPEDYSKAEQMRIHIQNIFIAKNELKGGTLQQLLANQNLKVVTNRAMVLDFMRNFSPHNIPARNDIAIMLNVVRSAKDNQNVLNTDIENSIVAAVGYTDFIEIVEPTLTQEPYYIPVIHITDIVSKIPSIHMMGIMLPLIAEVFVKNMFWYQAFNRFNKNDRNLGKLKLGPDKKPYKVESTAELKDFIKENVRQPVLVLDIARGRSMPLGLNVFGLNNMEIIRSLHRTIYGTDNFPVPTKAMYEEYTGFYTDVTGLKDSRELDYLYVINNADVVLAKQLQGVFPDRWGRIKIQRQLVPDIKVSYLTTNVVLLKEYVIALAQMLTTLNFNISFDFEKTQLLSPSVWQAASFDVNTAFVPQSQVNGMFGTPSGMNTGSINPFF